MQHTASKATVSSGHQGKVQPFTPISDPCVWTASTWAGRHDEFIYTLSAEDLRELAAATAAFTAAAEASGNSLSQALVQMNQAAFPLPQLGPKLAALADRQLHPMGGGRGFQLLRGLPMELWSKEAALVAYMGVAAHMGYNFSPQRKDGKMVHHIKAVNGGAQYAESTQSAAMGFHTDAQGDVLGLLCLQQAAGGGESSLVSAGAVHNEMLRRGRRDLVELMSADRIWCRNKDRYQHMLPGEEPWWSMPVFDYTGGVFAAHYCPTNHYTEAFEMYGAQGLGSMSEQQADAIQLFESIASSEEFPLKFTMAAGDMMFLDNTTVLHARSSFKDGPDPSKARHLVRLWLLDQHLVSAGAWTRALPAHLAYPRDYSPASGYCLATAAPGLMRPNPADFFVPLGAEDARG